jgi:hypothetical protein
MKSKGQSTLEYAVIVVVVMAAILAMQHYMIRGAQGKLRSSADSIGEQYSAGNTLSKFTTQQSGNMVTEETFGLGDSGSGFSKGISRYQVDTPAIITKSATGADAEKINTGVKKDDEKLF